MSEKPCTCHQDDRPYGKCQQQYAATDCRNLDIVDTICAELQISRAKAWELIREIVENNPEPTHRKIMRIHRQTLHNLKDK